MAKTGNDPTTEPVPALDPTLVQGYVLLKQGEPYGEFGNAHKEYLLLREDARYNIPLDGLALGSLAHTPGYKKVYEFAGSWYLCGDDEDEP